MLTGIFSNQDDELIRRAKEGDRTAVETLHKQCDRILRLIANQYHAAKHSFDHLLAETHFGFLKAVKDYNWSIPFINFVRICAKHQIVDLIRRVNYRREWECELGYVSGTGAYQGETDDDEEPFEHGELDPEYDRVIEEISTPALRFLRNCDIEKLVQVGLTDRQAEGIHLRCRGLGNVEIARTFGITKIAEWRLYSRACQRLRTYFAKDN